MAAKRGPGNARSECAPFATAGAASPRRQEPRGRQPRWQEPRGRQPRGQEPRWQELIARATTLSGARVGAEALAAAGVWLQRLEEWSRRIDLTAARSPDELVDLMLADALFLAPMLAGNTTVIDVGSGAGAPGLALALLCDELRLTLVESVGKRASFLRTVVGAIGRTDIVIERARGESMASRRAWDVAISRATFPPPAWLALGATLVKPGGRIVAFLAREPPPEVADATMESDESYLWPLTGVKRRVVVYRTAC